MADNPLLAALLGAQVSPRENLYGMGAEAIGTVTPNLYSPYASPGRNLASVAGAGLLAGLLGYQARREAEAESRALMPRVTELLGAESPEAIGQLAGAEGFPSRLSPLAQQLMLSKATQQSDEQAQLRKLQRQAEIAVAQSQAIGRPGALLSFDPSTGRPLIDDMEEREVAPKEDAEPLWPNPVNLSQRREEAFSNALRQGYTRTGAAEEAKETLRSETIAGKDLQKVATDLRDILFVLDSLLPRAERAIADAGDTGGLFPKQQLGAAKAASIFSESQRKKVAATEDLASLGPQIVQFAKFPGPISEREMQVLTRSGPSIENTPEGNKRIIENMKLIRDRQREYVTFINEGLARGYAPTDINRRWEEYRSANPLINEATGEINKNIKGWREYFGQQVGATSIGAGAAGSLPQADIDKQETLRQLQQEAAELRALLANRKAQ